MENFFMRSPGATWDRDERLHVYVVPNEQMRCAVATYHAELGRDPIAHYGLGLQPPQHSHFTVQMLRTHRDDVADTEMDDLVNLLTARLRTVTPFVMRVGPPQVGRHAVELWVEPTADEPWRELVTHTREAVTTAVGDDSLPPLGPNATPHTSIGYGVGSGDSGAIASSLKHVRQPLIQVPVEQVHLVAVNQQPDHGCYTWQPLATVPLGRQNHVRDDQ